MKNIFYSVLIVAVLVLSPMMLMTVPVYAHTPKAPTGPTATVNVDNSITFSWNATDINPDPGPPPEDRYVVEWGTAFQKNSEAVYTTSFTTQAGLPPGTYYFKVKAGCLTHTPARWSDWSAIVSATIQGASNPLSIIAPDDITVEGNTTGGATGIDLGTATASGGTPPYTITNDAPSVFPLGDTVVTWTVTDDNGDTASDTQIVTVVDTTPPTITAVSSLTVIVGAPSSVLPLPTVSDIVDPSPTVTNNAPDFFPLGITVVTWTATDASGNSATATTTVTAVYNFGGFLPPLVINGVGNGLFKAGSTIPVKFQLTDYYGNPVSTATGTASINTSPAASADIRYDATAMQYIANLKTPKGVTGNYTITVNLDDSSTHTISVTLIK